MLDLTSRLQDRFPDRVKLDEPMSKHTNFRLGGPARWFLKVKTEEELRDAVSIADEARARVVIHGGGSNVLYADTPIEALVLVPAFRKIEVDGLEMGAIGDEISNPTSPSGLRGAGRRLSKFVANRKLPLGADGSSGAGEEALKQRLARVIAGAGVPSAMLARRTAEAGLAGLTWMISLPGTIGGAVRGNAGCFGGETKDELVSARVLRKENGRWSVAGVSKDELKMSYRHSVLKEETGKDWIVLSATFELEAGDKDALKIELEETIAKRKASQPTNAGCAGCVFKNYEIESDEELVRLKEKLDIPEAMLVARRLGAGWIVEELGLKGFAIGGAKVSEVHGNFLVSEGASVDEIIQLIAVIKTRARDQLGIQLQEEIQFIS